MFVAASTRCFPNLSLVKSLNKLADLEYGAAEIAVGNGPNDLKPEWIAQDFNAVARLCLVNRQIAPVAFFLDVAPGDPRYFAKFELCLRLAKALRAVTLVVKSAPLGSPYNEEFERLRRVAQSAVNAGVAVAVLTERDAISGSVDSLGSLCKGVPELSVALDPSHFIFDRETPANYDALIPRTSHVRLRDTTAKSYQVQIGQGVLEYNRLVAQLRKNEYNRALCVDLAPLPNLSPESELRKMRLLMESIL